MAKKSIKASKNTAAKTEKTADHEAIGRFLVKQLKKIFPGVAENPLRLYNSTGCPLYLFCFAAANEKGAQTAVKIAQHILSK